MSTFVVSGFYFGPFLSLILLRALRPLEKARLNASLLLFINIINTNSDAELT